jgi:hypothetical protein
MAEVHPYKKFSSWWMQCINTVISLLKVLVKSRAVHNMPVAKSPKLLVLGTGPSFKISLNKNLAYFQSHPVLVVNSFSVTDTYTKIKPAYYAMLDPGIWLGDIEVMNNTLHAIQTDTSWPMVLFLPREAGNSPKIKKLTNPNLTLCYINYVVFKGFPSIAHFFFRRNRAMPQSQNVLVASLFLGVSVGFKRVELFGADHNWHQQLHVDENNIVNLKHVHFYENEAQLKFVPFWKMAHSKETFRMDEIFHAWAKVFHGYIVIQEYATKQGAEIVNRS